MRHIALLLLLLLANPPSHSPGADFGTKLAQISPQVEEMLAGRKPLPSTYDELSSLGSHVLALPNSLHDPQWTTQKLVKLLLMAQIVVIADRLDNPRFDFSKKPTMSVIPPGATGLPNGVAPSAIRDPGLRAEYEAKIAANTELLDAYVLQYRLPKYEDRWLGYIDSFILDYFSIGEVERADKVFDTLRAADAEAIRAEVRRKKAK